MCIYGGYWGGLFVFGKRGLRLGHLLFQLWRASKKDGLLSPGADIIWKNIFLTRQV